MTRYKPLRHKLLGRLYVRSGQEAHAIPEGLLWLDESAESVVYLCYALVTIGPEDEIFPAFLLDDWGHEQRRLSLYRWIREEGDYFPRAEIFGADWLGEDEQCFLRELELHARLPCYAYLDAEAPLHTGLRLTNVMLPKTDLVEPQRIDRPAHIVPPLSYARLNWWQGASPWADSVLSTN